jgi:PAS domain S-box-containing protein
MSGEERPYAELVAELRDLRERLDEAEETLNAITSGAVDAVVVSGDDGVKVFTLQGAEHAYRVLVEHMNEGAATLGSDGTVLYCNSKLSALLGTPIEKIMGTALRDFVHPAHTGAFDALLQRGLQESGTAELRLLTAHNGFVPIYLSCHTLRIEDVQCLSVVVTDITEIKEAEEQLRRANRALRVLSEFNQRLVRCEDESALLQEACRIIVEQGGYRMAWIGLVADDEARSVIPVAHAGYEEGYLERLNLALNDERTWDSPVVTTIRSGRIRIVKDIVADPSFAYWHDRARKRGYASLISLPVVVGQQTLGGLAIYAAERDAYDADETRLLTELVEDLSYGVTALRNAKQRKRVQEELRKSEEMFRAIFEHARDLVYVKDRSRRYTRVNPTLEALHGLPASKIVGRTDLELFGKEGEEYIRDSDARVLSGQSIEEQHTMWFGGTQRTFHDVKVPMYGLSGEIVGLLGISREITDHIIRQTGPSEAKSYLAKAMRDALAKAKSIAVTDSVLLLLGESGSGKDYMARFVHDQSKRASGPYFVLNCAAVTPQLAESELFGHEKGSFTGAHARKRGLLELAEGGTLLLNEIGELSPLLQSKLLTFLDTRSFTRVGGEKPISINARLIAATNRDLRKEVEEGRFRQDLFYRLNVLGIEVPPLRERREDFPILVRECLEQLATEMHLHQVPVIDDSDMAALLRYSWPGNVRELRNVLERALILWNGGPLRVALQQSESNLAGTSEIVRLPHGRRLTDVTGQLTESLCIEALSRSGGNKKKAAKLLGISRDTLYRYIKRFGLESESLTPTPPP